MDRQVEHLVNKTWGKHHIVSHLHKPNLRQGLHETETRSLTLSLHEHASKPKLTALQQNSAQQQMTRA
jgi:hypothetical protein